MLEPRPPFPAHSPDRARLLANLVLPHRIELWTSPLPRGCSTTELRQPRGFSATRFSAIQARRRFRFVSKCVSRPIWSVMKLSSILLIAGLVLLAVLAVWWD